MKKFLYSFLSVLILISLFASNAFAAVPDPGDDFYYLDQVGVMSSKTKSMLYENGEALKKACGAQIVVCVVDSFGRMSDEDFAYELINKWGVGDKSKKNGVALVIAETDGIYRMVIGTGLERYMDGAEVQNLLDRYFDSYFKDYKTDKGIQALYKPLFDRICSIYDVNPAFSSGTAPDDAGNYPDSSSGYSEEESGGLSFGTILMIVIILIIICAIINRRKGPRAVPGPGPSPAPGPAAPPRRTHRPIIIVNRPHIGGFGGNSRSNRPTGGFFGGSHTGGFGSSSRSSGRSGGFGSGSRSSGGFGGARGGGGSSRGIGGGGRR